MRRLRALAVGLALLAGGAWPVVGAPAPACAAGEHHAGLVVDTGAKILTYCVVLDAPSITGLHLIELAHQQGGLDYRFGLGGLAVCRLAGVGVSGQDCFSAYPEYWGYWHGDGHGGWSWSSSGAGGAQVGDGDLDGWVWGQGDSGTTHDPPPRMGIDDICVPAPSPSPSPSPATTHEGPAPSAAPTATPSHAPSPSTTHPGPETSAPGTTGAPVPPAASSPIAVAAPSAPSAASGGGEGGRRAGLLAGSGLTALLLVAGGLRMRARKAAR